MNSGRQRARTGGRSRANSRPRKKRVSRLSENGIVFVDFRDTKLLVRYLSEQGKIVPRRTSGNNVQQQRQLAIAIKRARHLALLPFVSDIQR
ncbi:MAG: 30S ribosomal protein S18 [Calditrichia bacterium]|nr:30S ribosomal protein S18 [Calditrichota bacterium]MCB0267379.1 30S ribosomal protein S18 [Calditrichota bacterium]MCB0287401.1 30S ribosomal protein S18 [Calditrichota bacterium]MCB9069360.1 30S ribosomal protein S18 [Calditrichia bacterium]